MTKWRNRVGADRLAELLKETIDLAVREKHLSPRDLERVIVDTTVQEKNITYPTDSKLRNKNVSRSERCRRRRRSAVEPKIGHLKSDHRMGRCFLAGLRGDAINAVLTAAGANMRKLLRRFFYALICLLEGTMMPSSAHCVALQYAA